MRFNIFDRNIGSDMLVITGKIQCASVMTHPGRVYTENWDRTIISSHVYSSTYTTALTGNLVGISSRGK